MGDELPSSFDAIVIGTGLTESIVAAALARIGKTVLHIDRNVYYGSRWASFSLRNIQNWTTSVKETQPSGSSPASVDINSFLQEGESAIRVPASDEGISDIQLSYHHISAASKSSNDECDNNRGNDGTDTKEIQAEGASEGEKPICHAHQQPQEQPTDNDESEETESSKTNCPADETKMEVKDGMSEDDKSVDATINENEGSPLLSEGTKEIEEIVTTAQATTTTTTVTTPGDFDKTSPKIWTIEEFEGEWRRFNFDMAPRMLYCTGDMVQLLIQSDISRYCEFKLVSRILTIFQNKLTKVPCSRAHVFSSKEVSMLEKRMMMKFAKSCLEKDNTNARVKEFATKPFSEYLQKEFSPIVKHYIYHGITMSQESTNTAEGIASAHKFFSSVGRYGNIPFITPIYGIGELPQAFSRMCAVWGGIYCLNLSAEAIIVSEGKAKGIITTDGKRIECEWLIMEPSYVSEDLIESMDAEVISRAMLITDQAIMQSPNEELSVLNMNPPDDAKRPVVVLEFPAATMVCPTGLSLVHFTRLGRDSPKIDFEYASEYLFNFESISEDSNSEHVSEDTEPNEDTKPNVLWSLFFQIKSRRNIKLHKEVPSNVFVTSQPGTELDLDIYPGEAQRIFESMYPDEVFHPKCPHPEDIIYCCSEENEQNTDKTNDEKTEDNGDDANKDNKQSKMAENITDYTESTIAEDSLLMAKNCHSKSETTVRAEPTVSTESFNNLKLEN